MKVKMLEFFQGTGQPTLQPEQVFDVDDELGKWLVENHKAVEVKPEQKPISEPVSEPQTEQELPKKRGRK